MRPREVERHLGVSPATVRRWVASGILPPPTYVNGRRDWPPSVVEDVRAKLAAKPKQPFPSAEVGRRVRDDFRQLRAAAGEALVHVHVGALATVLRSHGAERLRDVHPGERRKLANALRRLTRIHREEVTP